MCESLWVNLSFFFNDTATTVIYTYGHTLSLHDALPIFEIQDIGNLWLMRQVASVTTDCLTSDIGRFIRRKKGSQGGNVAGFSQPWRDDVPLYGFGENRQAFHRFSHDHPGRYGVTPDTLTPMQIGRAHV